MIFKYIISSNKRIQDNTTFNKYEKENEKLLNLLKEN